MNPEIVLYIYYLALLMAFVSGVTRYKMLDTASRIYCIYLGAASVDEGIAYYASRKYHNNLPVYSIYNIIELAIIAMYFNYSIDVFYKRRIGIYIAVIGMLFGIINIVFIQHLDSFNTYFLFFEGLCIIGMCLFSFFRLLLRYDDLRLLKYHHFWFTASLLLFWSITYLDLGLYDALTSKLGKKILIVDLSVLVVNILTYLSVFFIFLFYPTMQKINER